MNTLATPADATFELADAVMTTRHVSCLGDFALSPLLRPSIKFFKTSPNFAELAQILQQMGAVEGLNLDGGSSTSLYLGGSLLDQPPSTAARVHNAIGIFIQP